MGFINPLITGGHHPACIHVLVRRGSEVNKSQRYRLIVTGARGSGISSLVQLMARRDELKSHQGKDLLPSKTRGRCQKMPWKCWKNYLYMWLYVLSCVDMCVYSISRLSLSKAILFSSEKLRIRRFMGGEWRDDEDVIGWIYTKGWI